ncbi:MAG: hypothetical protein M9961_16990 [Ilumatobacteraceae bacterium]|nr:hypothetical protein [Ilumatobacteraceae bacterium]
MNLKSAARALGVHYQTAYRYVRSGDLVAVRVGNGYEISESAVAMLRSRLEAQDGIIRQAHHADVAAADTLEEELAAVVDATTLSARPAFELITRWLAEEYGDVSNVLLVTSGRSLQCAASFDRDAARRATVDAILSASLMKVSPTFGTEALRTGRTEMVHHVPVAEALDFVPQRFRQLADRLLVQSYLAVPLTTGDGRIRGILMLVRFLGAAPIPAEVIPVVERLAGFASRALDRSRHYTAAWIGRENLHNSLQQLAALDLGTPLQAVSDTIAGLLTPGVPEAVFSPEHELIAANAAYLESSACLAMTDDLSWRRLVEGPLDFTTSTGACRADATAQWGVVRRPDGTPFAVVIVGEPSADPPDADLESNTPPVAVPGVAAR